MRNVAIISALVITSLTSCEGWIHLQGRVYDRATGRPLDNVSVRLQRRGTDQLMENIKYEYDTIPYARRMELRKQGIKDDYDYRDAYGLSIAVPLYTDTAGGFKVADILVSCVPKCPTYNMVFTKEGYKTLTVRGDMPIPDSIQLEKIR